MNIRIGTFSKEVNSTKRPGAGFGTVVTVVLKEPSTLTTPVFELHDDVWKPEYNYIYVPRWNRYYFIHEAVIEPGLVWAVQCAVDVLASWKDEIRASTAYVRRSASNYSLFIPDPTWTHDSRPTVSNAAVSDLATSFLGDGCYILFTASSDTAQYGPVPSMTTYALTSGELRALCKYMFSSDLYAEATTGVDTTSAVLAKTFFNPFQYVIKCYWVPFPPTDFPGTASQELSFGWWTCPSNIVTGRKLTTPLANKQIIFDLSYGRNTDWTDRAGEWVSYMLYLPGFGEINLNPTYAGMELIGQIVFDIATGTASLFIKTLEGTILQTARGKLSADVQLSALYEDMVQDVTSFSGLVRAGTGAIANIVGGALNDKGRKAGGIGAALLGGPIGAAVGAFASGGVDLSGGIGGLAETAVKGLQAGLQPSVTTVGAAGDRATLQANNVPYIHTVKYTRLADDHITLGGMCCRTLALSGLSGYTEIVNPEINAPATSGELTMINGFLSGGFYLE